IPVDILGISFEVSQETKPRGCRAPLQERTSPNCVFVYGHLLSFSSPKSSRSLDLGPFSHHIMYSKLILESRRSQFFAHAVRLLPRVHTRIAAVRLPGPACWRRCEGSRPSRLSAERSGSRSTGLWRSRSTRISALPAVVSLPPFKYARGHPTNWRVRAQSWRIKFFYATSLKLPSVFLISLEFAPL